MRKNKHIQTSFLRFLLEKKSDEQDEQKEKIKKKHIEDDEEIEDFEEEPTNEDDEEIEPVEGKDDLIINELMEEYKRLKKKYESNKLYNRRK